MDLLCYPKYTKYYPFLFIFGSISDDIVELTDIMIALIENEMSMVIASFL
jgi:hypothetical protein